MTTRRFLPLLALPWLAGCPAFVPPGGDMTVRPASPGPAAVADGGAAGNRREGSPATPTPSATLKPVALPTGPLPLATARPGDVAPAGGTLADVEKAAGKPVRAAHRLKVETSQGSFAVVLFPDEAPRAVGKFLSLVGNGVYDGTKFHRVIEGFMAQGGDPNSKLYPAGDARIGTGGIGEGVPDSEFGNGLKHLPGSLAFAHSAAPNSSNTQFYVCFAAQAFLDGKYIVFGQVVDGFDVVQKITLTEKGGRPTGATPDTITRVAFDE